MAAPTGNERRVVAPAGPKVCSREIAAWASAHYGLVSRRKLLALGLSSKQIRGLRDSGYLLPAARGIYHVGHVSGVPGQREALALAAAGPGAALTGPACAAFRGMTEPWPGTVDLIVARGRPPTLRDVDHHTGVLLPGDATIHRGLRCTVPARAVLDLPPDRLRQALQWLMKRGVDLEPIVARAHGRRGVRAFRDEVVQLVPQMAHTMSELEDRFLRLCARYGIPLPVVNGVLAGGDLLDCAWPGHRLVVELDGRRWHEHRDREDAARDRRRQLEGLVPFRYAWADVTRDAATTASEVRRALAATRAG